MSGMGYRFFCHMALLVVGSAPVSYTHLDVYKRQILTLITVGKMLEARSKGKTTDALKGLMRLAPKTAVLLREGQEVTVPVEQVKAGDLFVVKPGESIPVDEMCIRDRRRGS